MSVLIKDSPGQQVLLMGNEAMARGALEAGVSVATGYPGSPSTEIIDSLASVADRTNLYVEWSVNEKVALEVAAAAALSDLSALTAMKQNGLNVALDFLANLNLSGIRGALVLVVCDDPAGLSSTNEQDSRVIAGLLDVPLLEPSSVPEARDMMKQAIKISRACGTVCMIRSVTRISHARSNVRLGVLDRLQPKPVFDVSRCFSSAPVSETHPLAHGRLELVKQRLQESPFNRYDGPGSPELTIITCGSGWLFAQEAISMLELGDRVGILKLGATWPLPERLILKRLEETSKVLFLEEVDPVLETHIKAFYADHNENLPHISFLGKKSGAVPTVGELSPELALRAISSIMESRNIDHFIDISSEHLNHDEEFVIERQLAFCPGCPHRASYWALKKALLLDGRNGVLFGDIGCYGLGRLQTGFNQLKTLHAMGSGAGLACGFGALSRLGADQPAVAVCGDSTFFHSGLPALINGIWHRSDFLLVILDNRTTAMTGFQHNPGAITKQDTLGQQEISIGDVCRSSGARTFEHDPIDTEGTALLIVKLLGEPGAKVLILSQECAQSKRKKAAPKNIAFVDPDVCIGSACGCGSFCTRVLLCPAIFQDRGTGKATIDQVLCTGCGLCAELCPAGAISRLSRSE